MSHTHLLHRAPTALRTKATQLIIACKVPVWSGPCHPPHNALCHAVTLSTYWDAQSSLHTPCCFSSTCLYVQHHLLPEGPPSHPQQNPSLIPTQLSRSCLGSTSRRKLSMSTTSPHPRQGYVHWPSVFTIPTKVGTTCKWENWGTDRQRQLPQAAIQTEVCVTPEAQLLKRMFICCGELGLRHRRGKDAATRPHPGV